MSHYVCLPLHSPSHNKGTNQFEPIEVRDQRYYFMEDEYKSNEIGSLRSRPPFKFSCLHDLESAWWIALWVLFHHVPLGDNGSYSAQTKHAATLFPSAGTSTMRALTFRTGLHDLVQHLLPAFKRSAMYLVNARALLIRSYKLAEKGSSIDESAFVNIHERLRDIWLKAEEESQAISYRFVRDKRGVTDETSAIPSKRPKFNPN